MGNIKILLLFISLAGVFSTCKKYPDGPLISFLSKQKRVRGEWQVESFTVNGVDSTTQLSCDYFMFGPSSGDERQYVALGCSTGGSINGVWNFTDNKKDLTIYGNPSSNLGKTPFVTFSSLDWEIQRLTDKQMWLKINYNGKEYYTKFKKM